MFKKGYKSIVVTALAIGVVFAFIAGAFSTAVAAPTNITGETRQEDDSLILRVAMQDDIKSLNPLVGGDVWTWNVIGYLYDGPINTDDEGNIIPYIAVGSASKTTKSDPSDYVWNYDVVDDPDDDVEIGEFAFTPEEHWANDPTAPAGETTIFYDFTGVTWHDGTQMTIRDVLFSYHVQAQLPDWVGSVKCLMDNGGDAGSTFPNDHYLNIELTYESADKLHAALTFKLQTPYADFFRNTLSAFLLPYHIWGGTESGQAVDNTLIWLDEGYTPSNPNAWDAGAATAWDNPEPVGNGPFKWNSWQKGVTSKIDTWRDHFYKEGFKYETLDAQGNGLARQPTIEAMVFKIYKTAEQAVLALKNNEVDYIAWSIPPTFVQELMNEPDVGIKQSAEKGFFYLAYNMRLPSFGYNDQGEDIGKAFRKAVAHCIDKQTIVQRLLQNFGIPGDGPVSSISTWYNNSIPRYPFDPQEAINILTDAGYQLTDPGAPPGPGNWWLNPDGSPIGSSAGGKIEILTPPADYDPIRAQAGLMIASQMQDIGINAESIAMDFGTIVERIDVRDFDMYILGWRIGSDPTDFLYAFFHSSTAAAGQNYPGYSNSSFDEIIELARATGDEDEREQAIADAQAAIAYDLPYDVLYFRTNIEAYRSDRFTGWNAGSTGSIYNWGSILNLKPPSNKWLNARFVNTVSAATSGGSVDVEVLVTAVTKNDDGTLSRTPIEGAWVDIEVTNGTLSVTNGTTNANGKLLSTYTAPDVPSFGEPGYNEEFENGVNVLLQINTAQLDEYDDAPTKLTLLTVYPEGVNFLAVQMDADPDVVDDKDSSGAAGITNIVVTVTDQDNLPVEGVTLDMLVDPAEPTLDGAGTTNADGQATYTFTAADVDEDKEYQVSVLATKDGYKNGTQNIPINVLNYEAEVVTTVDTPFPSFLVIASLFSVVAVSIAVFRKIRA